MPRFIHQLISTQCSYSTPCCHPSPPTQKKPETRSGDGRLCELGSLFRFILSVYVSMGNAIKLILDMYIFTPSQPETAMKLGSGAVLLVFCCCFAMQTPPTMHMCHWKNPWEVPGWDGQNMGRAQDSDLGLVATPRASLPVPTSISGMRNVTMSESYGVVV